MFLSPLRIYEFWLTERIWKYLDGELQLSLPVLKKLVLVKFGEKRRKFYLVTLISEATGRESHFRR